MFDEVRFIRLNALKNFPKNEYQHLKNRRILIKNLLILYKFDPKCWFEVNFNLIKNLTMKFPF